MLHPESGQVQINAILLDNGFRQRVVNMTDASRSLERNAQGLGRLPALLVVDIIRAFTDSSCPLGSDADSVVEVNKHLMALFHERGWPVVLTTVIYHDENTARVFRDRLPALNILTPTSHWVSFDDRLPIGPEDWRIEKSHASAFHDTDLNTRLKQAGVDSVVVTGLTTSGCVRASAVDALQYNYKVVVPREAVGDRDLAAHDANLFDLNAKYADVLSIEETMSLLRSLP